MEKNWDLNGLYKGFDETYDKDIENVKVLVSKFKEEVKNNKRSSEVYIESVLKVDEQLSTLVEKLYGYASLSTSTDVLNDKAKKYISIISNILIESTKEDVEFHQYLKGVDLDALKEKSSFINDYYYNLSLSKESAKHLLSKKEEILYSKMHELSGSSWGEVQELATANLMCNVNGELKTLSEIRNLAHDPSSQVRKAAFDAEIKAYASVEDFVALALSNIKRESNIVLKLRKYKDPIAYNLENNCHMSKESLNALIESIMEYRGVFAKYLKAKAKYLGHKKSLPFYDLFAPLGKIETTIDYDKACELVLQAYYSFSPKLGDFGKKAITNNWIDVYPKRGKVGGAFCANFPSIKESRVLINFTGSLDNCLTMAHELGHAYHGEIIQDTLPLNRNYPMQLAETASIFCETIMTHHLLSEVSNKQEKIAILEQSVSDSTQVIIDILSRYLFEKDLYKKATGPLSANELKAMMVKAQKTAYLDGLDSNALHPYMWLNKSHYYSVSDNFYNFPYAFGLLYGRGLYSLYRKNKEVFLKNYDNMLYLTASASAEDVVKTMGIDITKKDFWVDSLKVIEEEISELISLLEE
jgi:pepF/M3 family oligoendopeptidase